MQRSVRHDKRGFTIVGEAEAATNSNDFVIAYRITNELPDLRWFYEGP